MSEKDSEVFVLTKMDENGKITRIELMDDGHTHIFDIETDFNGGYYIGYDKVDNQTTELKGQTFYEIAPVISKIEEITNGKNVSYYKYDPRENIEEAIPSNETEFGSVITQLQNGNRPSQKQDTDFPDMGNHQARETEFMATEKARHEARLQEEKLQLQVQQTQEGDKQNGKVNLSPAQVKEVIDLLKTISRDEDDHLTFNKVEKAALTQQLKIYGYDVNLTEQDYYKLKNLTGNEGVVNGEAIEKYLESKDATIVNNINNNIDDKKLLQALATITGITGDNETDENLNLINKLKEQGFAGIDIVEAKNLREEVQQYLNNATIIESVEAQKSVISNFLNQKANLGR